MLKLEDIPVFKDSGLLSGTCSLTVTALGTAKSLEEAWSMLPQQGEGVVVKADQIVRYSRSGGAGLLLDADVVHGDETTIVRSSGETWSSWRWSEQPGDTHRWVEHTFRSSEGREASDHKYRQYWAFQEEGGIKVWRPIGSRFCGFQEK